MRYLFGSNLSKLSILILIMLAACSLACADDSAYSGDLSGQWNMVANTIYNFNLDLQQRGNQITGILTSTNVAEPVDTISGTISSDGTIRFTRERAGQWTQVYTGSLSGTSESMTITGSFDHNGQGQYPWSASKVLGSGQNSRGVTTDVDVVIGTVAAIKADTNRQVNEVLGKNISRISDQDFHAPTDTGIVRADKTIGTIGPAYFDVNRFKDISADDTSSPPPEPDGEGCHGTSVPKCGQGEKLICTVQCQCHCAATGKGEDILPPDFGNPDPLEHVVVTTYETQAKISFIATNWNAYNSLDGFNLTDQITVHGGLDGSNVEQFTMTKSVAEINSPGDAGDFLFDGLTPYTKYWFKISSNKGEHISGSFSTLCMIETACNGPDSICKISSGSDSGVSSESYDVFKSENRGCYSCGGLNEYCCAECADRQACDNPYTCKTGQCQKQSDDKLSFSLPESIYLDSCEDHSLDMDKDGLKDNFENALADAWRPYFIYDQNENDRDHNIDDDSLQSWEPRVLFQVRPTGYHQIVVKWAFLYRLDGGYRESWDCIDWHYGDTQGGSYKLSSSDGVTWHLDEIDLWSDVPSPTSANDPRIEWTAPRSTYWGEMDLRPSPIIHASAGKHHQYMTAADCEADHSCDDDCDGGAERSADTAPLGYFNNVGEPNNHPSPFVTDLGPLGYPGEHVWYSAYKCKCSGMGAGYVSQDCFTGGLGANWAASGGTFTPCTIPEPVYKLFAHEPLTPNPG